jgi:peptidoglycan/LPS O-acetylase OafA/YrhL
MLVIYFSLFILFVNNKLGFIVSKWSLFLGKISFALYLIHQYISIRVIIPYLVDDLHYNFWLASLFGALPVVILLASLITYFIEVPFSKKLKEKLRSLTSVKTSPSVGN